MKKPPYSVPSMAAIKKIKPNGLNVVSTFSGCGGSCLGYRMAGFKVLWGNEFIPAAQAVYRANHPKSHLDCRDIREVQPADILTQTGLGVGEIDLFDGSPPCASFSTAGRRQAGWGQVKAYSDTKQRTDDLFFEYVRLLDGLQPRVFVAENVAGLVSGTAKGYFLAILAALKGCGYRVACRVLDAQWLSVPQARRRTIFVGVRNDLGLAPVHPKPLPYRYSIRDAIPWSLAVGGIRETGFSQKLTDASNPSPTIMAGGGGGMNTSQFRIESESWLGKYATGDEYDKLAEGQQSEKYFSLVKPAGDQPCPAILASHGSPGIAGVAHPTERRKFSIAELKRICAFPDDFKLSGSYAQQWERLGRSVPPVMMREIAAAIRDGIFKKLPV